MWKRIHSRGGGVIGTVEMFDGTSWSSAPPMPTGREGHAVVAFDGKLYAIGGTPGQGPITTVEVFDGSKWSSGPDMKHRRAYFAAGVLCDSKIYVAGGYDLSQGAGHGFTQTVESFDGITWQTGYCFEQFKSECGSASTAAPSFIV